MIMTMIHHGTAHILAIDSVCLLPFMEMQKCKQNVNLRAVCVVTTSMLSTQSYSCVHGHNIT